MYMNAMTLKQAGKSVNMYAAIVFRNDEGFKKFHSILRCSPNMPVAFIVQGKIDKLSDRESPCYEFVTIIMHPEMKVIQRVRTNLFPLIPAYG